MTQPQTPTLPPAFALIRRLPGPPLPLAPLSVLLSALMRSSIRRHPAILRRMGAAAGARFLIDVTDAPVLLLMEPSLRRLAAFPRRAVPGHDAAIHGKLAAFLAMLHGAEDGDALFFSGDLTIAGDTAAVLSLRNALDDAEIDLTEELASLAPAAAPLTRRFTDLVARRTGLALSRAALAGTGGQP